VAHNVADNFEGPKNPETGKREGGLKGEIGAEFNEVRNNLADKDFKLSQKMSDSEIRSLAESSAKKQFGDSVSESTIKGFEESIKKDMESKGGKSVSAQTYYDNYRSLDHEIREEVYYLKKNKSRLTTDEIKAQKRKISEMQQKFQNMENVISDQSSPEIIERLKSAKNRWANEYAPLTTDPLYRKMVDKGIIDTPDVMDAIRGDDKASTILSRYFQTNPDAAELLGNYHFANKPMNLQNITEYQQKFINPNLTPRISRLIHDQGQAIENVAKATQQSKHFDEIRQNVLEQQKLHHQELAERQKIEAQIPKWRNQIKDLEHHAASLEREINNKKLTDNEVAQRKAKMEQIKRKVDSLHRWIGRAGKYGAIAAFLNYNSKDDTMLKLIEAVRDQKRL